MKKIRAALSLFLVLSLCGCWSSRELDKLAVVMGIAIEKKEDAGIECITQVIVPENVGMANQGSSGDSEPFLNFCTTGDYLSHCISDVSNSSGKEVYMSHNLIILIGRKAACDGIYRYLDYFMRDSELRFNVSLLVTDDNTETIFNTTSELMKIPATNMAAISADLSDNSIGKNVTVLDFIKDMMSRKKGTIVPVVGINGSDKTPELIIERSAVFDDDRMVGEISDIETRGVLWLCNEIGRGNMSLGFDNDTISLKINHSKTDLKFHLDENGNVCFDAQIDADMYLLRDDANIIERLGTDAVKAQLDAAVKSEIEASLAVMQTIGVDVYGFGDRIYRKNPRLWMQIEDNWSDIFKNLHVEVKVDCAIRESGSIIGSARHTRKMKTEVKTLDTK